MWKFMLSAVALATASAAAADMAADVEKRLMEQYPATRITAVRETQAKGIYEVVMGRNVAYTDEVGRYMIFGHLFDMKEQRDLTAGVLDDLNRIDVSALSDADAIVTVRGKGERQLYVFSDPECPYCRKLEAELAKLDNVAIHTFLYPLEGLHPEAKRKSQAIWCAKDRSRAWAAFMASGKLPDEAQCESPVERNIRLGSRLGINGTPSLIFGNGQMAAGALPAAEIERRLTGGQVQRIKSAAGG
jgi:thiol:disulfide interchange protein DsbC